MTEVIAEIDCDSAKEFYSMCVHENKTVSAKLQEAIEDYFLANGDNHRTATTEG